MIDNGFNACILEQPRVSGRVLPRLPAQPWDRLRRPQDTGKDSTNMQWTSLHWAVCWSILAFGFGGCGADRGAPEIELSRHALTVVDPGRVFGFEDVSLWTSTTATLTTSADHVQGLASLDMKGTNYNAITSAPLSTFGLRNNKATYAIKLPQQQPNPWWFGDTQMFVDAVHRQNSIRGR